MDHESPAKLTSKNWLRNFVIDRYLREFYLRPAQSTNFKGVMVVSQSLSNATGSKSNK